MSTDASAGTHLVVRCGTTWRQVFRYRDSAGEAIPLTGLKARAQIREAPSSPDGAPGSLVMELTSTGGAPRIFLDPTVGTVTIQVGSDDTPLLSPQNVARQLVWSLELYDDAASPAEVLDFAGGTLRVRPRIVQP